MVLYSGVYYLFQYSSEDEISHLTDVYFVSGARDLVNAPILVAKCVSISSHISQNVLIISYTILHNQ